MALRDLSVDSEPETHKPTLPMPLAYLRRAQFFKVPPFTYLKFGSATQGWVAKTDTSGRRCAKVWTTREWWTRRSPPLSSPWR